MFANATKSIAVERAEMMRDIEYMRESTADSVMQETILMYESAQDGLYLESDIIPADERKERRETIERIPDDDKESKDEIERIITSQKEVMNLDEVMGLDSDPIEDAEKLLDDVADLSADTKL